MFSIARKLSKRMLSRMLLLLTVIMLLSATIVPAHTVAYAGSGYGSWVPSGTDVYDGVGLKESDDEKSSNQKDVSQSNALAGKIAELIAGMATGANDQLKKGGFDITTIILGRVKSGVKVNNFGFELTKDNSYGYLGAKMYQIFRGLIYVLLAVYFIVMTAKSSFTVSAQKRNEYKDLVITMFLCFAALALLPQICDLLLFIRDILLKTVVKTFFNTDNGVSITGAYYQDYESDRTIIKACIYLSAVMLTFYFGFTYVSIAVTQTIIFVLLPIVTLMSVKDKKMLGSTLKQFVGNSIIPILDLLVLAIPLNLEGAGIVRIAGCFCVIPARGIIRQILGMGGGGMAEMMGLGAFAMAMRGIGQLGKGITGAVGDGAQGVSDLMKQRKEDKDKADMYGELADLDKKKEGGETGGFSHSLDDFGKEDDGDSVGGLPAGVDEFPDDGDDKSNSLDTGAEGSGPNPLDTGGGGSNPSPLDEGTEGSDSNPLDTGGEESNPSPLDTGIEGSDPNLHDTGTEGSGPNPLNTDIGESKSNPIGNGSSAINDGIKIQPVTSAKTGLASGAYSQGGVNSNSTSTDIQNLESGIRSDEIQLAGESAEAARLQGAYDNSMSEVSGINEQLEKNREQRATLEEQFQAGDVGTDDYIQQMGTLENERDNLQDKKQAKLEQLGPLRDGIQLHQANASRLSKSISQRRGMLDQKRQQASFEADQRSRQAVYEKHANLSNFENPEMSKYISNAKRAELYRKRASMSNVIMTAGKAAGKAAVRTAGAGVGAAALGGGMLMYGPSAVAMASMAGAGLGVSVANHAMGAAYVGSEIVSNIPITEPYIANPYIPQSYGGAGGGTGMSSVENSGAANNATRMYEQELHRSQGGTAVVGAPNNATRMYEQEEARKNNIPLV